MTVLIGEESALRMRQVPNETTFDVEIEFTPLLGAREDQKVRARRNQKGYAILNRWL